MNPVLGSGRQGDSKQLRVHLELVIVKKAVAQECGIVCIVAYFGLGLTGGELVWARNVLLLS